MSCHQNTHPGSRDGTSTAAIPVLCVSKNFFFCCVFLQEAIALVAAQEHQAALAAQEVGLPRLERIVDRLVSRRVFGSTANMQDALPRDC